MSEHTKEANLIL